MKQNSGDILAVVAAVLLVFTPLLNPLITSGVGIALIVGLGIYHFVRTARESKERRQHLESERRNQITK